MKNNAKAKPCPFCHSKDIKFVYRVDKQEGDCCKVECVMCGARGPETVVPDMNSEENPLEAWNERSK